MRLTFLTGLTKLTDGKFLNLAHIKRVFLYIFRVSQFLDTFIENSQSDREDGELSDSFCFMSIVPVITKILTLNKDKIINKQNMREKNFFI